MHCFLRKSEFVLSSFSVRFLKVPLILKQLIEFVPTIFNIIFKPFAGVWREPAHFGRASAARPYKFRLACGGNQRISAGLSPWALVKRRRQVCATPVFAS